MAEPQLATVLGLLEAQMPMTLHSVQPFIVLRYAAPKRMQQGKGRVDCCPDCKKSPEFTAMITGGLPPAALPRND